MSEYGQVFVSLFFICAFSSSALAQEDENARVFQLDSITVRAFRYRSPVKSNADGVTVWDMESMRQLPQLLGYADPMHYAQMLPGIQTNSECRSGINIEGCDNQHNAISIGGVPIYNVNHLFGFFSTFNVTHYPSLSISKSLFMATSPNRLGGQLDMQLPTEVIDSVHGTISLGLIASQGTVCVPLHPKTTLTLSGRGSYMNLLYSRWLKPDGQEIKYSFYDTNATLVHQLNKYGIVLLDFYHGSDMFRFDDNQLYDMKARWGNTMGAAHWIYDNGGGLATKTTLYTTAYRNSFRLEMPDMSFRLPSGIMDVGMKGEAAYKGWNVATEAIWHNIRPQSLDYDGNLAVSDAAPTHMHSFEMSLSGSYDYRLVQNVSIMGGLRGALFRHNSVTHFAIDPSLRLMYDNATIQVSATYALKHQYLFQTGFTDAGLPTEFWLSATDNHRPQYAHELMMSGAAFLFRRRYRLSADLFYRKLYHQLIYRGTLFDLANTEYDLDKSLAHGQGKNYGFSLMLNKCTGKLTGWVSYTYTHARRSFDTSEHEGQYPASHERPHELNAVATCTLGRHWSFGGTMVYASGTPFTMAKSLYLLNNNVIIKYGEYNAARLKPYMRIDLSANYKWYGRRRREKGLNLSLYNVTSRGNELFYYLRTRDDGSFAYRPVTFFTDILPSVSFYYKF